MPWRYTNVGGESIHRDETTGVANAIHGGVHVTINPADVDASGQDLLSDPRGLGRNTPTLSRLIELLPQREGQRIESCRVPHETILWLGKQRSGAMRPQPDTDDGDAPRRAQIERTKQLTGKDDRCLARPISVRVQSMEWITEMQNDLGPAVGQHRLRASHLARVAVECPDSIHDERQGRNGRVFPIDHAGVGRVLFCGPAVTVTCVSLSFKRTKPPPARVSVEEESMSGYAATIIALAVVLGLLDEARAQRSTPATRGTVAQLAWLTGTWRGGDGPVSFEERWTPPAGGAMLAVSRTLKGDRMVAFEFLRIVERDGRLIYIAQPNGRPPTEFILTAITPDSVTFENPMHDFPKMIRYTRRADGALEARVSDGGQKAETFVFKSNE